MILASFERQLRILVETRLLNLLPGQKPEDLLVQAIIDSMGDDTGTGAADIRALPDQYTLLVHPESLEYWKAPEIADGLLELVRSITRESRNPDNKPFLVIASDPKVLPGEFRIVASQGHHTIKKTQDTRLGISVASQGEETTSIPANAYLLLEGSGEFALHQSVINIGRRLDNDLVLEDPRVSRKHAQLRAIGHRFMLFDLNSSGGTYVNGLSISQSLLSPGDVISLGGVSMVFGQEQVQPHPGLDKTAPSGQSKAETNIGIVTQRPTQSK